MTKLLSNHARIESWSVLWSRRRANGTWVCHGAWIQSSRTWDHCRLLSYGVCMTIIGIMAGFAFGYSVADLAINIYETWRNKSNNEWDWWCQCFCSSSITWWTNKSTPYRMVVVLVCNMAISYACPSILEVASNHVHYPISYKNWSSSWLLIPSTLTAMLPPSLVLLVLLRRLLFSLLFSVLTTTLLIANEVPLSH